MYLDGKRDGVLCTYIAISGCKEREKMEVNSSSIHCRLLAPSLERLLCIIIHSVLFCSL